MTARASRTIERLPWRLRVVLLTLPATLVAFGAVSAAPGAGPSQTVDVRPASEARCIPFSPITSVDDLNGLVTTMRGSQEFQGADVGADVRLQDGRRLWVFGDTLRSADFDGQRFVRNSMLVFSDECADVVIPADRGALVPDRDDGVGYWPMSIAKVERPGYDLVGLGMQRVRGAAAPDGAAAFKNLGSSIALFVVPRGRTPQLLDVRDLGPDSADASRPAWGAATAVDDGWIYLYGTAQPDKELVFGFSLQVARVRPDDLLDASRWRYWDGRRWQSRASSAAELIGAEGGVSQTLSVFEQDGRWYAVSKRDEFLGTDLVVWSAPAPTGPFTASAPVAQIPSDEDTGQLRYMRLAHPDLLPEKGSVIVSYSQNQTDVSKVVKDPFLYRPRFLRVPLPR
ncbi:DUF4185 domain-containing protein [Aeromicrobium wangtongii]|uniref:DUF4185 domain-containing protein n=1 Tax=Aeromicrobium wangtongii TaxID=2969247 RepID=UPI002017D759|nr:DUF4185 domain-containing protein [Aeromicrobium wangtongii]MCL3818523.1 DUF4185 domain-containing protein [Aeromicrobium wangtongii]